MKKLTTAEFITKAQNVHGDKYDYSLVEYVKSNQKVTIICPAHGVFEQTPNSHLRGLGCAKCAGIHKSNTPEFIAKARKVHGNKYDYSLVEYVNNRTKTTIMCAKHGLFVQTPNDHLTGYGCPRCAGKNQTTEDFIEKSRVIHGDEFDYSLVTYKKASLKVDIICKKHGVFRQRPNDHLSGLGCALCAGNIRYTTEEFILIANTVHGNKYTYEDTRYLGSHSMVDITCPDHGSFKQIAYSHIQGFNCPRCVKRPHSRKALRWLDQISTEQNINIQHAENGGEFTIPSTRMKADGYCRETNTIYEFHGDAFHGNPQRYQADSKCHPFDRQVTAGELYQKTIIREEKNPFPRILSCRNMGIGL